MKQKRDTNNKLTALTNLLKIFEPLEQQDTDFSAISKFVRTSFGVNPKEMAMAFKITERAYRYWEDGERVPKGLQAFKLWYLYQALVQGVSVDELSKAISQLHQNEAA